MCCSDCDFNVFITGLFSTLSETFRRYLRNTHFSVFTSRENRTACIHVVAAEINVLCTRASL